MKDYPWLVPNEKPKKKEEEPKESEQKAEESNKDKDEDSEETDDEDGEAKTWTLSYLSEEDPKRGFCISITHRTLIFASCHIDEEIIRHTTVNDEEKRPKIMPICP